MTIPAVFDLVSTAPRVPSRGAPPSGPEAENERVSFADLVAAEGAEEEPSPDAERAQATLTAISEAGEAQTSETAPDTAREAVVGTERDVSLDRPGAGVEFDEPQLEAVRSSLSGTTDVPLSEIGDVGLASARLPLVPLAGDVPDANATVPEEPAVRAVRPDEAFAALRGDSGRAALPLSSENPQAAAARIGVRDTGNGTAQSREITPTAVQTGDPDKGIPGVGSSAAFRESTSAKMRQAIGSPVDQTTAANSVLPSLSGRIPTTDASGKAVAVGREDVTSLPAMGKAEAGAQKAAEPSDSSLKQSATAPFAVTATLRSGAEEGTGDIGQEALPTKSVRTGSEASGPRERGSTLLPEVDLVRPGGGAVEVQTAVARTAFGVQALLGDQSARAARSVYPAGDSTATTPMSNLGQGGSAAFPGAQPEAVGTHGTTAVPPPLAAVASSATRTVPGAIPKPGDTQTGVHTRGEDRLAPREVPQEPPPAGLRDYTGTSGQGARQAQTNSAVASVAEPASSTGGILTGATGAENLESGSTLETAALESRRGAGSVPVPETLARAPLPGAPTQQLAEALRQNAPVVQNSGSLEVALHPEELGRVRLVFTPADAGLTVTVQADRSDTLEVLRRNIDLLANDLREQGYERLSFEFDGSGRDGSSRGQSDEAGVDAGPASGGADMRGLDAAAQSPGRPTPSRVDGTQLDLRL